MKQLIVDATLVEKLPQFIEPVQLVDADGKVFGVFEPYLPKAEHPEPPGSPPATTA